MKILTFLIITDVIKTPWPTHMQQQHNVQSMAIKCELALATMQGQYKDEVIHFFFLKKSSALKRAMGETPEQLNRSC